MSSALLRCGFELQVEPKQVASEGVVPNGRAAGLRERLVVPGEIVPDGEDAEPEIAEQTSVERRYAVSAYTNKQGQVQPVVKGKGV